MRRVKHKKKLIIYSLIGLLFVMVVGYAAFQTKLEIKGTSNISSEWRIEITGVSVANKNGLGESVNFEHTTTTASMEANLYEKGDYVEYNVEVSNLGTLDGTIDNIANNIKSTNKAVKISFGGYTKGEVLKAKEKQIIKVKVEYDSNYSGEVSESPAEVEVQPEYVQQSPGSTEPVPDKYLVSYDCETNGGSSCSNYNEYLTEGSTINLGYTTTYKGYKFIGWNTDKTATRGLTNLTMGTSDVTLYAIFTPKNPPIIDNVNTSSTTNSITIAVSAHDDDSRIVKYEYSIDGVNYFSSESNSYTFNNLSENTIYPLYVKVTNEDDLSSAYSNEGKVEAVPTNDLLFWGQADNKDNTSTVFKDKSGNGNDGAITSAAFKNSTLEFDGKDDYVNIGLANYDFKNSISYVMYVKVNLLYSNGQEAEMFSNYEGGGSGINITPTDNSLVFAVHDGTEYVKVQMPELYKTDTYYAIIGTFDGNDAKLYLQGQLVNSTDVKTMQQASGAPVTLGADWGVSGYYSNFANMSLKEAMLYDRALTEDEITNITDRFNTRYGVKTKNLEKPIFSQTTDTEVIINYPDGCGSKLTCTYEYNDKTSVTVTGNSVNVPIDQAGNIIAKVTDGTNSTSSNHTVLYNELYVASTGNDGTGYGTKTKPYATTSKAYTMATNTASIKVMDNITSNETTNLNQNKDITLTSYSEDNTINSIIRGNSQTSYVLNQSKGNLILENITIDGNNVEAQGPLLGVDSVVNIEDGVTLQNSININDATTVGGAIYVQENGLLNMNGGQIQNNKAVSAGGINVVGTININDGIISDNTAERWAGGFYCGGGGKCTMKGGTISNNIVNTYGGGGINSDGDLTLTGGTISNNTVATNGGGVRCANGSSVKNGQCTLGGAIVFNNRANQGGGVYVESNTTVTVNGGNIIGNTAVNGGGMYGSTNSTVNMTGGVIEENHANGDATNGNGSGGGIYSYTGSTINLSGGKIINNIANKYGGGIDSGATSDSNKSKIVMSDDALIDGNTAKSGGGVLLWNTTFEMKNGKISNNKTSESGGAVSLTAGGNNEFIMTNGTISGNKTDGNGGGVFVNNNSSSYSSVFTLDGGTISGNSAVVKGGGIYGSEYSAINIKSGSVSRNKTTTGHGGGGIHVNGSLIMSGGVIENNSAEGNPDDGNGNGGGIVIQFPSVSKISGGKIINNTAARAGGGIVITDGSLNKNVSLTISGNIEISGNKCGTGGGGIMSYYGNLDILGGIISNNTTSGSGGGVHVSNSVFVLDGGEIKNNTANVSSGGISNYYNSTYTYKSGIVCGNTPTNEYETHATCPAS